MIARSRQPSGWLEEGGVPTTPCPGRATCAWVRRPSRVRNRTQDVAECSHRGQFRDPSCLIRGPSVRARRFLVAVATTLSCLDASVYAMLRCISTSALRQVVVAETT